MAEDLIIQKSGNPEIILLIKLRVLEKVIASFLQRNRRGELQDYGSFMNGETFLKIPTCRIYIIAPYHLFAISNAPRRRLHRRRIDERASRAARLYLSRAFCA